MREIMDRLAPSDPCRRVVLMKGAQTGGSEAGNCWLGYIAHLAPGPTLIVQPSVEMAEDYSTGRINPMVESTPALAEVVGLSRSRQSTSKILLRTFQGGFWKFSGANSAASLRSKPIRYLFADEVDSWDPDVDGEGDPLGLARKRCATFPNRKELVVSTPKIAGSSRIDFEYRRTDQRRYFVPCPDCGVMQALQWGGVKIVTEDGKREAFYVCGGGVDGFNAFHPDSLIPSIDGVGCGSLIADWQKTAMLAAGEWRATAPEGHDRAHGYHLSSLYSPHGWRSWTEIASDWLAAQGDPSRLKIVVNTDLAECWQQEDGETLDEDKILVRREDYGAGVARAAQGLRPLIPRGVIALTAGADTQDNRLEVSVWGWGAGEESWLIGHWVIWGCPAEREPWAKLDGVLLSEWPTEDGRVLRIAASSVDVAGHYTDEAIDYCRPRFASNVFGTIGRAGDRPIWPSRPIKPKKKDRKYASYVVGIDQAKQVIYARLKRETPGAGYIHLPATVGREYVEQLAAEALVTHFAKGRPVISWRVRSAGRRNEALDCAVLALASLRAWERAGGQLVAPVALPAPVVPSSAAAASAQRRGGAGDWLSKSRRVMGGGDW
jgi:phage terminase large subunit GpA-like protein